MLLNVALNDIFPEGKKCISFVLYLTYYVLLFPLLNALYMY